MMPSAKIAIRSTAPPANMLNTPSTPLRLLTGRPGRTPRVDARQRDVGAEAVDQQRAEREPDAFLQVFGLGEGAAKFRLVRVVQQPMPCVPPLGHAVRRRLGGARCRRSLEIGSGRQAIGKRRDLGVGRPPFAAVIRRRGRLWRQLHRSRRPSRSSRWPSWRRRRRRRKASP